MHHAAQGRTPRRGRLGGRLHGTRYAPAPRKLKCGVERPSAARRCRRCRDGRRRRCCRGRARPGRARRGPSEQRRRSRSRGRRSGYVPNPRGHAHHRDGPGVFLPLPFPVAPTVCPLRNAFCEALAPGRSSATPESAVGLQRSTQSSRVSRRTSRCGTTPCRPRTPRSSPTFT